MALSTEEVIKMVAEAFDVDPGDLSVDTQKDDLPEWDSMGMLMLMAELDEQLNMELDEEELQSLSSIQDIVNLVGKQAA